MHDHNDIFFWLDTQRELLENDQYYLARELNKKILDKYNYNLEYNPCSFRMSKIIRSFKKNLELINKKEALLTKSCAALKGRHSKVPVTSFIVSQ
ncbi:MAG TPA: hypothetical protein VKS21_02100 [Spirochaetota bacterium]|nr:hypothetical protein [Spirochaetota bacterium]